MHWKGEAETFGGDRNGDESKIYILKELKEKTKRIFI